MAEPGSVPVDLGIVDDVRAASVATAGRLRAVPRTALTWRTPELPEPTPAGRRRRHHTSDVTSTAALIDARALSIAVDRVGRHTSGFPDMVAVARGYGWGTVPVRTPANLEHPEGHDVEPVH